MSSLHHREFVRFYVTLPAFLILMAAGGLLLRGPDGMAKAAAKEDQAASAEPVEKVKLAPVLKEKPEKVRLSPKRRKSAGALSPTEKLESVKLKPALSAPGKALAKAASRPAASQPAVVSQPGAVAESSMKPAAPQSALAVHAAKKNEGGRERPLEHIARAGKAGKPAPVTVAAQPVPAPESAPAGSARAVRPVTVAQGAPTPKAETSQLARHPRRKKAVETATAKAAKTPAPVQVAQKPPVTPPQKPAAVQVARKPVAPPVPSTSVSPQATQPVTVAHADAKPEVKTSVLARHFRKKKKVETAAVKAKRTPAPVQVAQKQASRSASPAPVAVAAAVKTQEPGRGRFAEQSKAPAGDLQALNDRAVALAVQGRYDDARMLWDRFDIANTPGAVPSGRKHGTKALTPSTAALQAQSILGQALTTELQGNALQARALFARLIKEYGSSSEAALARRRLGDLEEPLLP